MVVAGSVAGKPGAVAMDRISSRNSGHGGGVELARHTVSGRYDADELLVDRVEE
jgi:hypothetical protein